MSESTREHDQEYHRGVEIGHYVWRLVWTLPPHPHLIRYYWERSSSDLIPAENCPVCGEFVVPTRKDKRYCSARCANTAGMRRRRAEKEKPRK